MQQNLLRARYPQHPFCLQGQVPAAPLEAGSIPLHNTCKTRQVYLPNTVDWYDFWTSHQFNGGQVIEIQADIDRIPIFVKAGAIIPMADPKLCTKDLCEDTLYLKVYPGADGQFTIYQDENDGYGYEQGHYALIEILWKDDEEQLIIKPCVGSYNGMPEVITFHVDVIGSKQFTIVYPIK